MMDDKSNSSVLENFLNGMSQDKKKYQNGFIIREKRKAKSVDDFVELGWYTLYICFTTELNVLCQVCTMMFMVHAGAPPKVVGCGDEILNGTKWCDILPELRANSSCQPKLEYQFHSVNVEFDRLCDQGSDVKNSISIQMFGVLIGAAIFGQISDSFGRKPTLMLCMVGMTLFGFITSFAGSLTMFTLWRCVIGFFCGGQITVLYVYILEQIPRKHSLWIAGIVTWSPNYVFLALISYYSHDWRTYSRVVSYLGIPALVFTFFACESPRWFMQKGKYSMVKRVLQRMRFGLKFDYETEEEINEMINLEIERLRTQAKSKQHYIYHLFYTRKLATYTIMLGYGYFLICVINYGLLFNLGTLSGSIYWNSAIFGIFRWSINILAGILDYCFKNIGRKIIQFTSTVFILISLLITFVIYAFDATEDYAFLLRCSTLAAAAMTSQGYICKNVVVVEAFPTAIRNIANSVMGATSRVGSMVAPQIFLLGNIWSALPYLTMVLFTIVELLGFQFLIPETKNAKMVDHLPDKKSSSKRKNGRGNS